MRPQQPVRARPTVTTAQATVSRGPNAAQSRPTAPCGYSVAGVAARRTPTMSRHATRWPWRNAIKHQWDAALATLGYLLGERPAFRTRPPRNRLQPHRRAPFRSRGAAAFEQAVALDPSLVNSWKCLAKLYEEQRPRHEEITRKTHQRTRADRLPRFLASRVIDGHQLSLGGPPRRRRTALQALPARQQDACGGHASTGGDRHPQQGIRRSRVPAGELHRVRAGAP